MLDKYLLFLVRFRKKLSMDSEQIAWKFMCKGKKRSKIKKLVLYKNYNDGGLRMTDIMSSQNVKR